jgi:hypothetical protein
MNGIQDAVCGGGNRASEGRDMGRDILWNKGT